VGGAPAGVAPVVYSGQGGRGSGVWWWVERWGVQGREKSRFSAMLHPRRIKFELKFKFLRAVCQRSPGVTALGLGKKAACTSWAHCAAAALTARTTPPPSAALSLLAALVKEGPCQLCRPSPLATAAVAATSCIGTALSRRPSHTYCRLCSPSPHPRASTVPAGTVAPAARPAPAADSVHISATTPFFVLHEGAGGELLQGIA